ncbi:MAG: 4-hydroxythreonine-4-phosphate dehydrogenase PdxA [Endomicrobiia bacterium]
MFKKCIITCGEPIGVGYEIILKVIKVIKVIKEKNILPIVIGNLFWLNYIAKKSKTDISYLSINKQEILQLSSIVLPKEKFLAINVLENIKTVKQIKIFSGLVSFSSLEIASDLTKTFIENNENVGILTMPVSKNKIQKQTKKHFLGHTEYFAKKFNISKNDISMLMMGKDKINYNTIYKVLLLTRHIPLKKVSVELEKENIVKQIKNVVNFLTKYENIKNLEILFCGLNPHLGENGKIGLEEKTKLFFAVKKLKNYFTNKNIKIVFPILTEQAFKYAKNKNNTLIVCNYHDQAMIPLKILCGYNIANITVGLPFIRISPGHGTAEDIMLKNKVDISSSIFCIEKLISYLSLN